MNSGALSTVVDGIAETAGVQHYDREPDEAPGEWEAWLQALFPEHFTSFADRHVEFWEWVWSIEIDSNPHPFIGIWPRGGGKSTGAEGAVSALGLRNKRKYVLYVRETQDMADKSVENVQAMLEQPSVERFYPLHATPSVGKHGNRKGWRRNRLRTAGGLTVDALGLDSASRGVKVEDKRPDLIVLDDLDDKHDSAKITKKKEDTLTDSILQAFGGTAAVLGIQNLIIPNGIFSKLADGRADYLARRYVSGPHPAIRNLKTEKQKGEETGRWRDVIVHGEATWEGQDPADCQRRIDRSGLSSFIRECQNDVQEREGALWSREGLGAVRVGDHPNLQRIVVGVDPSGGGDDIGIVVAGLGPDGKGYVLEDATVPGSVGPNRWGKAVRTAYRRWQADKIVAEKNFGGDMVKSTIQTVEGETERLPVNLVNASRGKQVRAEPVASLYGDEEVDWQDAEAHHVGTHAALETEMTSWVPDDAESPNRMDALVWALTELMLGRKAEIGGDMITL